MKSPSLQPCKARTASHDGLMVSWLNGSKPVNRIIFRIGILVTSYLLQGRYSTPIVVARHDRYKFIKKYSSAILASNTGTAVATCALITAFLSGSSSSAAGTILKLAAIGVMSVPQ